MMMRVWASEQTTDWIITTHTELAVPFRFFFHHHSLFYYYLKCKIKHCTHTIRIEWKMRVIQRKNEIPELWKDWILFFFSVCLCVFSFIGSLFSLARSLFINTFFSRCKCGKVRRFIILSVQLPLRGYTFVVSFCQFWVRFQREMPKIVSNDLFR